MIRATMSTRTLRKTRQSSTSQIDGSNSNKDVTEKENGQLHAGSVKLQGKSKPKAPSKAPKVYCLCRQQDDGSPMIICSECKEWYHFRCLELDEREAEDLHLFVCPSCHEKTGLRSVMDWEGPEAIEERKSPSASHTPLHASSQVKANISTEPEQGSEQEEQEQEGSSDDGSEDDYVVERKRAKGKRRAHLLAASDSESGFDGGDDRPQSKLTLKKLRRASTTSTATQMHTSSVSPGPVNTLKRRKSSAVMANEPPPKRKRSQSTAGEDAARKYCLTKLQEMFCQISLRYPILQDHGLSDNGEIVIDKKPEELTAEEKEQLETRAKKFATDLEECMFELYSEQDKNGKHGVAAKYKERFRMLSFNLSKPDRVILHKRIASSHITPKELSTMSSTDLANEETKQSIRQAEQEALAHSILKKTIMPRAKMTHKGIQDIEDISGASQRDREREREQEEEERIERERLERLKLQAQRAQAAQGSVPPESPVTPQTPSHWGGPPPVPLHAQGIPSGDPQDAAAMHRPSLSSLFIPSASDLGHPPVEQELNLADLINIDEEPGQEVSISLAPAQLPVSESAPDLSGQPIGEASQSPALHTPSFGLSPFATRSSYPDVSRRPSFDLNAIWTPKEDAAGTEHTDSEQHHEPMQQDEHPQETKTPSPLGVEIIDEEADDLDFDMFLEDTEAASPATDTPEAQSAAFDALPKVWSGKLSMPLDSTIPQEVSVQARQTGGRTLGDDSPLWKTLFPVDHLRIDGRVPTDKSAQYLTAMRLNPAKELIAVAFSPDSDTSATAFDTLSRHLTTKGRHGLVFPWGNRPKEHHPGRELYIVPLAPTEPIPEFIELLDELRLPPVRTAGHLIGIWVLNKGRLAPPAGFGTPPMPTLAAMPSQLPSVLSPISTSLSHSPVPIFPQPTAPNVSAASLAAEVASLTPEQIQLMLRTLTANSAVPIATQQPAPPPQPPAPVVPLQQAWMTPPQTYPGQSPYPPVMPSSPPPFSPHQHYDQDRPPYPPNREQRYESFDRGSDRGPRGRSNSGSWGRGRGQDRQDRPRDAGWRGRARGRGGRGAQSGSYDRGSKWGGSPSQHY